LRIFEGHSNWVMHVVALPDGQALSASHDKTLRLWNLATGECLRIFEGHSGWVRQFVVLPDGRALSASMPSFAASANSSSQELAPRKKLKCEVHCSSA
jgi:WD40 repeat protein